MNSAIGLSPSDLPGPGGSASGIHHADEKFQVFPIRVTRVDYERRSLSVRNLNDNQVYNDIIHFPAQTSSLESTGSDMPEFGQSGLGVFLSFVGGYAKVGVITWTGSDIDSNIDAIAHRPLQAVEGYSTRYRGVYRKAYPGQRSVTRALGYHEFQGSGWDRLGADLSQDRLDAERRQWHQITGRRVTYDDAGLRFSGAIQRPGADVALVPEERLPDGTTRQVVYLQEKAKGSARYLQGQKDLLPMSEVLEKVQEFSVDFPIPYEILESGMLDDVLGTTKDPWGRTAVVTQADGVQRDDQSFLADQGIDDPHDPLRATAAVGPTRAEGPTPRRRGFVLERVTGTLVGYNRWDKGTYGRVLKPTLWPLTRQGRFGTDTETGHLPVAFSTDHVETRLAATAFLTRFPAEHNTTRVEVTKEGLVLMEIGATLPKENIPWDSGTYEHPWGAGRSLEAHLLGSAKVVLGKNRDEEDSLDLATLGQVVMRLGADDGALPFDGRTVAAQNRGRADAVTPRTLQTWDASHRALKTLGDAGDLTRKVAGENVSLRGATDGGVFLRLGARHEKARRRHLMNGYSDAPGREQCPPGTGSRAATKGRPTYGAGDALYAFHDLRTAGKPSSGLAPYFWAGDPVQDMDAHGLSLDAHAVRDVFIRVGKNKLMGQSILLDLEGGIVGIVGKDSKGRSLTGSLEGGIELTVGSNNDGRGIQLEIIGDVNMAIKGNWHVHSTGDIVFDAMGSIYTLAKKENVQKGMNLRQAAMVQHVTEAIDIVNQQGGHPPTDGK